MTIGNIGSTSLLVMLLGASAAVSAQQAGPVVPSPPPPPPAPESAPTLPAAAAIADRVQPAPPPVPESTRTAAAAPPSPPEAPVYPTDSLVEALVANGWTKRVLDDGTIILEKRSPTRAATFAPPARPAPPEFPTLPAGALSQAPGAQLPAPPDMPLHEGMMETPQVTYQYKIFPGAQQAPRGGPPIQFNAYNNASGSGTSAPPAMQQPHHGLRHPARPHGWQQPPVQYQYYWRYRQR